TNQSVNQNGCDSTTILQLYVLPVDSILITDIICPGISYTINGFDTATHHTTGGYIIYDTNQNINKKGCDSISMLALTVLPVDSILVTDTICAGNTYASNGFYTTSVSTTTAYIIYDTNQSVNQNGCDSISMLALYVQAVDSIIIYDTICSGKHYTSNGFDTLSKLSTILYTIFDTNQNINHKGCDSITILQLTVWPVDSIFITDTICAGENYNDNGFVSFSMFTTTGYTVFDTNRSFNQYSSDSITLLHLTILPVDSVIIHDTICAGCRYSHKGFDTISLYSTIEYTIYDTNQTTNQNGCDSITMLGLLVLPVDSVLIVDSVCSGRNYTSNSFNITTIITTKEYIINDTNQSVNFNGCDSITSLHLTVLPVDSIFIADTICAGRNYVLNGFNIKTHYTTTGYTVFDTNRLYNHNGSDSITIIQLTVLAVDSILIKDTICCGSHYTFNGFDTLSKYTVSGYIIYDTNQNINQEGCDSISMLQLTVFPVDSVFIIDTICAGNHYTHHGFDTITIFTNNGYTIFDTNKTANKNGCDSVTILILSVLPHELVDIADNICSGEQYTSNGFNISTIYSTKSYTVIDTNFAISQYGCDSTTILSLTVLPVDSISISDIICSGEYYNLNGFKTPTTHSTYSYTLYDTLRTNTKDGCKCIKTLQLLVLPVDSVYIYDSICSGNVYDLNGFNIKAVNSTRSHVINDTNRNRNLNSCDSITILQLTVLATDSIFIIDTVCAGEHYKSNGFNVPTQSSIEGYFINKSNHFVNEKGCDSTTSLLLIVNPIPDVDLGHDTAVCPGVSYPIELNAGANFTSYLWNTGERTQKINVMQEGNYTVKTQNIHKCENSDTVKVVDLTDFYVQIESLSDFCDYHKTTLIANTDASSLIWNTGDTSDNIEIHIHGTYSVKAYEMGCMVADFFIVDSCLLRLFIPNAITPSDKNDVNDCFEIVYPPYFPATDFEIIIFDRWGNKAFKSNDLYFKWCGTTSNDNTSHNNIFTYIINFYAYGVKHTFKGTITVL
ncbi:MAG: hypothetical protein GX612_02800, partial [Bacteroidales bacterium]|nr:hypothetical protein [Bacteroidales bacterium]